MATEEPTAERLRLPASSLRVRALTGVKWTSASAGAAGLLTMLQTLIVAHLLSPAAFGLMAGTMVVVGLAQVFRDMGITNAIIVRPAVTLDSLSSLYWANLLSGVVVGAVVLGCTPLVVDFYQQSALASLMPWVALSFVVGPVGNVSGALLQRELRFDVLAKVDTVAALVGLLVTVSAAATGGGAVSLALGYLGACSARAVLLAVCGRTLFRPRWHFRRSDLGGFLSFGGYQMGFGALDYLRSNVDYLLIGRFLGPHALGVYSIAFQFVSKPQMQINPILTRVATPVFAKRQHDDAALRRGYLEVVRLLSLVTMPLLVGIAVVAPALVPVAFGARWHDAVIPLQILAFVGILNALGNPLGSLTLAKNRPDIEFKLTLLVAPVSAGAIFLAVHHGVSAVALAVLGVLVGTVPILLVVLRRLIGLPARALGEALSAPVLLTAAMAAVTALAYQLTATAGSRPLTLAVSTAAGAFTYLGLLVWRQRAYLRELWSSLMAGRSTAVAV